MPSVPGLIIDRWKGPQPPSQQALQRGMAARGLHPYAWSNGPGFVYATHRHGYIKHLAVSQGSIRFTLEEYGEHVDLAAGDSMILPAGVAHGAVVGPEGVTCLEGTRSVSG